METYWGIHPEHLIGNTRTTERGGSVSAPSEDAAAPCALTPREFWRFLWQHRAELFRFLRWAKINARRRR